MVASKYIPAPINTDRVILSPELAGLAECLAVNAHELWAQQKIKDGCH
jgi:RyR domain